MNTIYTIGHSNLPISDFIKKLKDNKIKLLVDIRTKPYSRYNPQFNKNTLCQNLIENAIAYSWKGANLGGLGDNVYYQETIDELIINSVVVKLAIMCSEADYKKCHRYSMITPDLEAKEVKVIHILPNVKKLPLFQ